MAEPAATLILGIDPGSRITGYGLVEIRNRQLHYIDSGCIRAGDGPMPERLSLIFSGLQLVMQQYHPTEAAVEQVFLARNPDSALKLGQARGAALVALTQHRLPISEYTARQVKQAVVGLGQAAKEQVQHMVMRLLHLDRCPQADAADALAVAICHAHTQAGQSRWLTGRFQGGSR